MKRIHLVLFIFFPAIVYSQIKEITGKVTAFNKYPLENIIVKAKKSKASARTDKNGYFTIETKKKDLIRIKDPEFMEYDLRINEQDCVSINLILIQTEKNVNNAISKGYLTHEEMDYALKYLERENSAFALYTDVYEAIRYAVPEASQVENTDGSIGFIIRGSNSLEGNNNALYLVNNSIIDDISFIAPSEIKSIRKLSNSQAAMFGSRASNGIIAIETY